MKGKESLKEEGKVMGKDKGRKGQREQERTDWVGEGEYKANKWR